MPIGDFTSVQFGLCYSIDGEEVQSLISIDESIQIALIGMIETFYNEFDSIEGNPMEFELSQKYGTTEKLVVSVRHEGLDSLIDLYNNNSLQINCIDIFPNISNILYYFAIFIHNNSSKSIGIKRPSQFKGLLKSRNKLIKLVDDSLQMVEDSILKLDHDFDFVIQANLIDILHPTGFYYISDIDNQVLASAQQATIQLNQRITFVNFPLIAPYVGLSKRASRLIASIRNRNDLESTSKDKLVMKCRELGVRIREEDNLIYPEDDCIVDFLNILDRRGYDYDLTHTGKEFYLANNRIRINQ